MSTTTQKRWTVERLARAATRLMGTFERRTEVAEDVIDAVEVLREQRDLLELHHLTPEADPAPVLRRVQDLEQQRAGLLADAAALQSRAAMATAAESITDDQVRVLLAQVLDAISEAADADQRDEARLAMPGVASVYALPSIFPAQAKRNVPAPLTSARMKRRPPTVERASAPTPPAPPGRPAPRTRPR